MVTLTALAPNNLFSGKAVSWEPMNQEVTESVLRLRMPRVVPENRAQAAEEVIRKLTRRPLV